MLNTAEKNREADIEAVSDWMNDDVERWLREDVVRICKERAANPSRNKSLEQAFTDIKARLEATYG